MNVWDPADRQYLRGGIISYCGCRPIIGTKDPSPGMSGPVWHFYFVINILSGLVRTVLVARSGAFFLHGGHVAGRACGSS